MSRQVNPSPFTRPIANYPIGQWGFRGVRRRTDYVGRKAQFYARIKFGDAEIYSQGFQTATEAAQAYDNLARRYHGKEAILNFPESIQFLQSREATHG